MDNKTYIQLLTHSKDEILVGDRAHRFTIIHHSDFTPYNIYSTQQLDHHISRRVLLDDLEQQITTCLAYAMLHNLNYHINKLTICLGYIIECRYAILPLGSSCFEQASSNLVSDTMMIPLSKQYFNTYLQYMHEWITFVTRLHVGIRDCINSMSL